MNFKFLSDTSQIDINFHMYECYATLCVATSSNTIDKTSFCM